MLVYFSYDHGHWISLESAMIKQDVGINATSLTSDNRGFAERTARVRVPLVPARFYGSFLLVTEQLGREYAAVLLSQNVDTLSNRD